MKTLISGHREHKLTNFDRGWILNEIGIALEDLNTSIGLCGMANGIDLDFCRQCIARKIHIHCYIPFEQDYMSHKDFEYRAGVISMSTKISARNSSMVENCDNGIIVFDGNKGGTHNVFQQMLEKKKPFIWIEPNNKQTYKIGAGND